MTDDQVLLTEFVPLQNEERYLALLTINRPKALNALNLQLVHALFVVLQQCQERDDVSCVVLCGAGERGFCAGGDVKEMYASAIARSDGECIAAEAFFEQEYRMDYLLHSMKKPVVAWGHGIVMGGGLGILQACSHRVVTPESRLAMPEIVIALYPDVGASYFLNHISKPWGRFLALTGATVNATESIVLGLADIVLNNQIEDLVQALRAENWQGDAFAVVSKALNDLEIRAEIYKPESRLSDVADEVNMIFSENDLAQLVEQTKNVLTRENIYPWLRESLEQMLAGSPLSLCCIDQALQYNQKKTVLDVFKFDLIYATNLVRHPEFIEGVRAQLIEKDKNPQWLYKTLSDVPAVVVSAMLAPPWERHPFDDL